MVDIHMFVIASIEKESIVAVMKVVKERKIHRLSNASEKTGHIRL